MPARTRQAIPATAKIKIPNTPASGAYQRVFQGQEDRRNETRAALFGDSDADTDEDHENAKIGFEIEEEEADELGRKQLDHGQMVITRMHHSGELILLLRYFRV